MNIGGLVKTTLLDYPGKISAVIFTHGCNLKCPYCHNPELVTQGFEQRPFLSEESVLKFLSSRVGQLDGVVITGGEPLLQQDILNFIKKIKDLGFAIKLDTNGLLPNKLKDAIKSGNIDCIAMDVKYPQEGYDTFSGNKNVFEKIQKSIGLIMNSGLEYEFRTTYVKGIHDKKSVQEISKMVQGASNYFIQNFRPGKTIKPDFSSQNSFTDKELNELKAIASRHVKHAEIRN